MSEAPKNFVATALAETKERRRLEQEEREHQERFDALPALRMADCITSGLSGQALVRALHHHFPNTSRPQVYFAVGLAVATLQADLVLAQMEVQLLRSGAPLEVAA
ncbi:MAG: hypothetical protein RBU25_19525 [Lentisphaeria bacterium]|jgi:hypothetical protein|nr:hypothetical protein [Lentisphaeria bacterium]